MCDNDHEFDRRSFLRLSAAAGAGALMGGAGLPHIALGAQAGARRKTLVWIYAGGGNDGMHMFPRYGDRSFETYRPNVIGRPGSGPNAALPLAGSALYGLNPNLAPLQEIWNANRMAISMATAVDHGDESHFTSEALMFRGADEGASGLLARYLDVKRVTDPMAAIRAGAADLPAILSGGPVPAQSIVNAPSFDLKAPDWCADAACADNRLTRRLAEIGGRAANPALRLDDKIRLTEKEMLAAFERVRGAATSYAARGSSVVYPQAPVGQGLKTVAQLLQADIPVEVAFVSWTGAFDRHADLVEKGGLIYDPAKDPSQYFGYAQALRQGADAMLAFYKDMGPRMDDIVVLVTTEFGRRIGLGGTNGLDHGFGGAWFMFGGAVRGGIYADPGNLAAIVGNNRADLVNLPKVMNYRDMVGEVMSKHMGVNQSGIAALFPGHSYSDPGMIAAAAA